MSVPFVLDDVLPQLEGLNASDLHLSVGSLPLVRVDGSLTAMPGGYVPLTDEMVHHAVYNMLSTEQAATFERELELDLAYSLEGVGRFRVNLFQQRQVLGAAFRRIDNSVRDLETLGVPASLRELAYLPRGLVLVTGPTGSGKSTTLASIIDIINTERYCHIMTIEDPIEFLHRPKRSLVSQREVGTDTHSFAAALKHVLRQDPDVILIGELRDLESISAALTAAETGHLVFATLHTVDAAQSIDRIIDTYPPHQQSQVRTQLAGTLRAVVSQTLLPKKRGGRAVATELLRMTPAIANLIREGETHQIYSALQSGSDHHMHTLDQSLMKLVRNGEVECHIARDLAGYAQAFDALMPQHSTDDAHPRERSDDGWGY